ncbi:hypothetical protein E2C01_054330 [Portunus trituberculatus]|uniref:Uncharacterized protein n=1 Tax=Portunus trituberculatus TaxID=210409 RepID=A0A5B7GJK1_PORTR|nr:hypothetical protein [Portunus trituberculatus]
MLTNPFLPLRHGGRYSYSALEDDAAGERLEMERKAARGTTRDTSALAARSYLRGHQRYSLLEHLRDIDSAVRPYRVLRTCPASAACSSPQCPPLPELVIRVGILHTAQSFMSPRAVYWLGKTVTSWADFILRNPMLLSRCSEVGSLVATCANNFSEDRSQIIRVTVLLIHQRLDSLTLLTLALRTQKR